MTEDRNFQLFAESNETKRFWLEKLYAIVYSKQKHELLRKLERKGLLSNRDAADLMKKSRGSSVDTR